jgi:hypothetical protein
MKKIPKKAKKLSRILEGVLFIKSGVFTVSLTQEEIYELLVEHRLIVKDGEGNTLCKIE